MSSEPSEVQFSRLDFQPLQNHPLELSLMSWFSTAQIQGSSIWKVSPDLPRTELHNYWFFGTLVHLKSFKRDASDPRQNRIDVKAICWLSQEKHITAGNLSSWKFSAQSLVFVRGQLLTRGGYEAGSFGACGPGAHLLGTSQKAWRLLCCRPCHAGKLKRVLWLFWCLFDFVWHQEKGALRKVAAEANGWAVNELERS